MLAVRGGVLATVIVSCEVAVCCGEPLSLTVRVIVKDPVDAYTFVVEEPVPTDPSPKLQE